MDKSLVSNFELAFHGTNTRITKRETILSSVRDIQFAHRIVLVQDEQVFAESYARGTFRY